MESAYLNDQARNFDRLPDSARVGTAVVTAILGRDRTTLHRYVRSGILPRPRKFGGRGANTWSAGEIRAAIAAMQA